MAKLLLFNPWNEMAIADGGNGFIPNKAIRKMEEDIAPLLWLFSDPGDIILIQNSLEQSWLKLLSKINPSPIHFLTSSQALQQLKQQTLFIDKIEPWGWSPRTLKIIEPFIPFLPVSEIKKPMYRWNDSYKEIYGRQTALTINRELLKQIKNRHFFIEENEFPQKIYEPNQLVSFVRQWKEVILKTPHSSSGRGIMPIKKDDINRTIVQRARQAIEKSGYAMVEPRFRIVAELSIQFKIEEDCCSPLSLQAFRCDENGNYIGNFVSRIPIDEELMAFIEQIDLPLLANQLAATVENIGLSSYYQGYFGIDMLIYRTIEGELRINPCSEINIRKNMGVVAHYLSELIPEYHFGFFQIINRKNLIHNHLFTLLDTLDYEQKLRKIIPLTPYRTTQYTAIVEIIPEPKNQPMLSLGELIR